MTGRHRRDHPPDEVEDPRDEVALVAGGPTSRNYPEGALVRPQDGNADQQNCRGGPRRFAARSARWILTVLRRLLVGAAAGEAWKHLTGSAPPTPQQLLQWVADTLTALPL